ncbi:MAG: hypothetical protein HY597_06150 [Candidatus Omnitrophica bacterium]|nr:hypothetical protein [Candidatus Omnitrophota bacterium]
MKSLPLIPWTIAGLKLLAAVTGLFGAWSALRPARSIALYQAIMRRCNWHVEPIDRPRELLTTRWLGAGLILCSVLSALLLWGRWR